MPAWPEREILLSEVLAQLLLTGTRLTVATNDHPANQPFPQALGEPRSRSMLSSNCASTWPTRSFSRRSMACTASDWSPNVPSCGVR